MKKKILRTAAAALALLLAFAVLPLFAVKLSAKTAGPARTVPAGYNAHDYEKCAAFLELTDEYGTKNGTKLSGVYDVNDPSTWGTSYGPDEDWNYDYVPCFGWYYNGTEQVLRRICVEDRSLSGELDLSGCTSLNLVHCPINSLSGIDVSGCTALEYLTCYGNDFSELDVSGLAALTNPDCASTGITRLDVTGCTSLISVTCQLNELNSLDFSGCASLRFLHCEANRLASVDLTGCTALGMFFCFENELTALDLSDAAELERLICYDNRLTELDLSSVTLMTYLDCTANPLQLLELPRNDGVALDTVRAEGSGTFGCEAVFSSNDVTLQACPYSGAEFLGWYAENGIQLGSTLDFYVPQTGETAITARFSESAVVPGSGDIDGNGETNVTDAILALRIAMGILSATPEQIAAGDMNGDCGITVQDAIIILRTAMGI